MATFDFDTIWKEVLDKIEESQYFSEDTLKTGFAKPIFSRLKIKLRTFPTVPKSLFL